MQLHGTVKEKKVILVREETNPEDVEGMRAAEGILTARGGMTSHAALVARGWGKCCIVGAGQLHVDAAGKKVKVAGSDIVLKEGDLITLNGTKGNVYIGAIDPDGCFRKSKIPGFHEDWLTRAARWVSAPMPIHLLMQKLPVNMGAEGIGLFRTEHMFYGEGSDQPLFLLRKMILSDTCGRTRKLLERTLSLCQERHQGNHWKP